jgi:hypothetical protein
LRRQIARGAREALEEQYWDIVERTVQARPVEARLGGDPSIANKVRAFLLVRYYRNGEWEDRIEVCRFRGDIVFMTDPLPASRWPAPLGQAVLSGSNWTCERGVERGTVVTASHRTSRTKLCESL